MLSGNLIDDISDLNIFFLAKKKKKKELDWCFLTFKAKNAFLIAKPVKISDKNKKTHQAYKLNSLTIVRKVTNNQKTQIIYQTICQVHYL